MKRGLALIVRRRRRAPHGRGRRREDQRHDDHGRGQHVRAAARLDLDAGPRFGVRLHGAVQRRRLGCRHRGDHEPAGRLRRLGCAADADQATACGDCVQIPWALSATAVAYNVPGAPAHLNLDGTTISKIFLGQITNWNDPAIAALNKGANLPNLKITPVFRSDGSGTSYNFTDYLSSVNADVEVEDRRLDAAGLPGGSGRQGLGRRRRAGLAHERRDRLRRRRVRDQEPHPVRGRAERGREVPLPEPPADQGGGARLPEGAGEQRDAHRRTRRSRRRSRTRSAPTPTSSCHRRRRTRPSSGR